MNWLLLYYDLRLKKYCYRIFGDLEDLMKYRVKIQESRICRTNYTFKLYGKHGGFI